MKQISKTFGLTIWATAAAILVSACGGGASPPNAVAGSSGFAVDDYLSGATVLCDSNNNGSIDAGETTVTTDSSGFFKFATACTSMLVVTGGTNVDTHLPFNGKLRAPAGSTVVTPLTTLLAEGMTMDQVNSAFGLPPGTDVKSIDPARRVDNVLQNGDLFKRSLALQQLMQKTTEVFAALASAGGDAAKPAIFSEVAAAMAATLRANPSLVSGTTMDQTAIAALVKAAALRVSTSTLLSPEIKNGVLALNFDSLAQVMAASLKAQAEAILKSSDANLTGVTTTAQGDTQIASFIQTNKGQLGGPPNGTTATLAASLGTVVTTALASGGGGTPPPPPPPSGTLLVSFDENPVVFQGMGAYGDAAPSVVTGPTGGSGSALKILKAQGTQDWGGIYFNLPSIPFAADRKIISARVNSTRAGAVIRFKVESANGGPLVEIPSSATGAANTWQTVTWDMTGVDIAKNYTTIAITPDFGVVPSGHSYFIDDIALAPAVVVPPSTNCATQTTQCISFSESTIALLGFEGMASAAVVNDPVAGASNKVAKLVKGPDGQLWAGATIYTAGTLNPDPNVHSALSIETVGLNTPITGKIVTVRSYTGAAVGTKMTLKLENAIDPGINIAAETVTTVQNQWETLTFNFANLSTGVFSANATYNTASIFPAFSIPGPNAPKLAVNTDFYFDELKYAVGSASNGGGSLTAPTDAPATVVPQDALKIYTEATTIAGFNARPDWGQATQYVEATIASNKSLKYTSLNYEGMEWTGSVDVSGKTKMHLDFWSPDITSVKVSLISAGPLENAYTQVITTGGWNSVDIDLSNFTVPNKAAITQIKLEATGSGTLYVDNIYFWGSAGGGCGTTAPTCAPTTTIPAGSVTIYSEATTIAGFNARPDWGQATQYVEATIASNKSLKYTSLNYEGMEWTGSVDVSGKTKMHLDFWSPDITSVKVSLISAGPLENAYTQVITTGSWNSVDIDLSNYTVPNKAAIIQIKLEATGSGTLYVDNIYFWGNAGGNCGTTTPTCAPGTSIPAGSTVIYSDAASVAGLNLAADWGQGASITRSEVTIASNKSEKYVFSGAPFLYQGIDWSANPVNVSTKGTLHLDFFSPDITSVKVSLIGGGSENGVTKTVTPGSWNAIDIDMALFSSPDKTQIIQIKLEPATAGTLFVDNIHFYGTAAAGGGGGGTFTGGIFASDYSGNLGANTAKSDKGGTVGFFLAPALFNNKAFEDGSVCGSACNPGGVYNFYYGIGKLAPAITDGYFGAFVNAPGNTSADASAYSKINLKFWGDAESWEKPNFTASVDVVLQGPANAACSNSSGRPELTKTVTAQKIGAGSLYTILKTDFTLTANCGGAYTVNTVWSAISAVVVRLSGTNLQYVNTTPSTPVSFPTFINVGPISFIN